MYIKTIFPIKQLATGILVAIATFSNIYAQGQATMSQLGWEAASAKSVADIRFICLLSFRDNDVELPIDFTTDTFLQNRFVSTWVKGYKNMPAPLAKKLAADSQYEWNIYLLSPTTKVLKTMHGPLQTGYVYVSLEDAQKDEANITALYDDIYRSGRRDTAFLSHYFTGDKIVSSIQPEVLIANYCHTLAAAAKAEKALFPYIQKYITDIQSEAYDYVLNNRDAFISTYGQNTVDQYIGAIALTSVNKEKAADKNLSKAMMAVKKTAVPDLLLRLFLVDMKYYYRHKRPDDMIKCMDTIVKLRKPEVEYYEEVAYGIFLVSQKQEQLRKAESYILESINRERTPVNTLIYAKILYAMGRTEDAQIFNMSSQNLASAAHYKSGQTDRMLESCASKLK